MAYALTCACGYVRRLLVVSLRPLSLPTRKLEAQGGAPPAKLGRRGDACGAVGDPPAPARPGDRRRGKERDEAAMHLAVGRGGAGGARQVVDEECGGADRDGHALVAHAERRAAAEQAELPLAEPDGGLEA